MGRLDTSRCAAGSYVGICCMRLHNSDVRTDVLEVGHSTAVLDDMWVGVLFKWCSVSIY